MKSVLKEFPNYIISLFMMMLILLSAVMLFTKTVILNENYCNRIFGSEEYVSKVTNELKEKIGIFSVTGGVPQEILEKNLSDTFIKSEIHNYLSADLSLLKSNGEIYDTQVNKEAINNFKENLSGDIRKYYPGIKANEVKNVTSVTASIINSYCNMIDLSKISSYGAFKVLQKAVHLVDKLFFMPILILLASIFMFLYKTRGRILGGRLIWTGSSIIAAAWILIIPSAAVLITAFPGKMFTNIEYVNYALKNYLTSFAQFFLTCGVILICLGIACMVQGIKCRNMDLRG
ncbi:MAG: hypothetical protein ABRQ25_16085 [Clostridiaceae bacterium]